MRRPARRSSRVENRPLGAERRTARSYLSDRSASGRRACGASSNAAASVRRVETGRVEAFSDGVFAIAITLLILAVGIEQSLASGDLRHTLLHLWPAYVAYIVSFLTIGIMWVNHHQIFRHFERVDRPLLLLNILLLMCISFTPFPTRVVADNAQDPGNRQAAAVLYGSTMTFTAICFFSVWYYGSRRLLRADTDMREVS